MGVTVVQPLSDDLGFLLTRAAGVVVRATNAALADHGLRVRQYSVLVLAVDAGTAGLTQRELAASLGLDPSQVVLLVDDLEAAGLVVRRPSETDRRARRVVVTERGATVRREAGVVADAAVDERLGLLSEGERDRLRDVLTRVWTAAG